MGGGGGGGGGVKVCLLKVYLLNICTTYIPRTGINSVANHAGEKRIEREGDSLFQRECVSWSVRQPGRG